MCGLTFPARTELHVDVLLLQGQYAGTYATRPPFSNYFDKLLLV